LIVEAIEIAKQATIEFDLDVAAGSRARVLRQPDLSRHADVELERHFGFLRCGG
jgi:hypothetical protein